MMFKRYCVMCQRYEQTDDAICHTCGCYFGTTEHWRDGELYTEEDCRKTNKALRDVEEHEQRIELTRGGERG
jgi:hypothetical protein